jgi:hypothetical protein
MSEEFEFFSTDFDNWNFNKMIRERERARAREREIARARERESARERERERARARERHTNTCIHTGGVGSDGCAV